MSQTLERRNKKRAVRRGVGGARLGEQLRRLGRSGPSVWFDRLAIAAVLLVAALFTGTNMFRYPQYELDEGTYMGSAWAMFEQGALYFYTYAYDHTLLGWFQIGAFAELVGGFLTFGTSVNTGRVLMLFVAILSTLLVYLILRHATGRVLAGLFGAVVFAVSPLGVTLHRQVWLDNFATLWLLVSLYALVTSYGRLWRLAVSALAFSLAFWSKEVVVVFLPGMLYLTYALSHRAHRRFAFGIWGTAVASVTSLFLVLALLKDEFLPPGVLWSSDEPHVSMIETYRRYAGSESGSPFSSESDFRTFFEQWVSIDAFLIVGGLAAVALGLLFWRRDKLYFGMPLLAVPFLLFLALGGLVRFFYVIPLLPILALSLGLLAGHAMDALGRLTGTLSRRLSSLRGLSGRSTGYPAALAVLGLTVVLGLGAVPANSVNFNADRVSSQAEAMSFVANNLPNESAILMDPYPWADLRDEALVGDEPFRDAHAALTALQDPAILGEVLQTPGDVDYMLYGAQEEQESSWIDGTPEETGDADLPLVEEAYESSDRIRLFESSDWRVKLLRVRNLHQTPAYDNPMLQNTWESYKENFVEDGRVVDPKAAGATTSEGQAYAMLRAVYVNDREAFDELWGWTQENLQKPNGNFLLAWRYGETGDGTEGVTDSSTATDADTDAALALLFAARKFDAPGYEEEALAILTDVWEEETTVVGSALTGYKRVAVAGDWARGDGTGTVARPVVNPSYLSPYAYKIFAEADPEHPWDDVVDSSYEILQNIQASPELGGEAGVVPNWVALDPATVEPVPADLEGLPTDEFSFDASRVPWRIGLDYLWFQDDRALDVLENLSLPREEIESEGRLFASHALDGEPTVDYEATSAYAGILPGLLVGGDSALAHKVFVEKILGTYNAGGPEGSAAHWGEDPDDYYNQNMAWFATAVMDGSMSNLYAGEEVIEWDRTSIDTSLAD